MFEQRANVDCDCEISTQPLDVIFSLFPYGDSGGIMCAKLIVEPVKQLFHQIARAEYYYTLGTRHHLGATDKVDAK